MNTCMMFKGLKIQLIRDCTGNQDGRRHCRDISTLDDELEQDLRSNMGQNWKDNRASRMLASQPTGLDPWHPTWFLEQALPQVIPEQALLCAAPKNQTSKMSRDTNTYEANRVYFVHLNASHLIKSATNVK